MCAPMSRFRVLRETLQSDGPEGSYQRSDSPSIASVEEEAIGSSLGDLHLRGTHKLRS